MLRKRNEISYFFKYIFYLLNLNGIYPMPKFRRKLSAKNMLLFLSLAFDAFVVILHLMINYEFVFGNQLLTSAIVNLYFICVATFQRIILKCRMQILKKISHQIIYMHGSKPFKELYIYALWMASTVVVNVTLILSFVIMNLDAAGSDYLFFSKFLSSEYYIKVVVILYFFTLVNIFMMPNIAFMIYYTLTCQYLKNLLYIFRKSLDAKHTLDYPNMLKTLSFISKRIEQTNSCFDIIVFASMMLSGASMYFVVALFLHPSPSGTGHIFSTILSFLFTFSSFCITAASAIAVNDESARISAKTITLPSCEAQSSSEVRFHLHMHKEMAMNIWGIGPIKRSIMTTMFGTIITYSLLMDSIESINNSNKLEIQTPFKPDF